ncbi:chromosome segregation ATPase [Roseimicrobium gellanilyticum]|uniref:Chromosome segregation ATPase n=1 Tax=Roseimicrobium gellanilyticum TaxID=748857 RepID=A0A366HRR0_9BACT|nr:FHA domain-containing protein [Roseimicrobium gellanilyticum]RBP46186.1 chromosome segregation ATPase [Roseimicrobium gellanilyticum]
MAKLTFILDDGETIEVPLHDSVTIGRADGNDVVVYDPRISSRHAELHFLSDGKFEVRDLASKAGTYVNGERVERKLLGHGDQVSFGPLKGEFSTEIVLPPESTAPSSKDKEGGQPGAANASAEEGPGVKPAGEPKEKSEKSFLSSVLAAMGAKSINGGKSADAKGGKPERKADATPAAPAAKAKSPERPAPPRGAPGTPQAKASSPAAEPPKSEAAKPVAPKPTPAAPQPAAKAPDAAVPLPGGAPQEDKAAPAASNPPVAAPEQPAPAPSAKTPDAEAKPVVSEAPKPAEPAIPVGTPPPAEVKSEQGPVAGRHVDWEKDSRQESKPVVAQEPESPTKPAPAVAEERPAEPAKSEKPKAEETVVVAVPEAAKEMPAAPKEQSEPPVPEAQVSSPGPKEAQEKAEVPSAPTTPAVAPTPASTAQSAPIPEAQAAVPAAVPVQAATPTASTPLAPEAAASVSGAVPVQLLAPSKSTTPVKVAAGPALDQRIVNLVYNRLEGEAKEAITKLEERQKSLDTEVTRLRDEIIRMQGERRGLAQEQVTLRESIQTENRELETLRGQHKAADTQMQQMAANLRQGQERLDVLLAEEKQLSVVTSQLAETESRRDQVLKTIEEHTAEGEAQKTKLKEEIEGVAAELEAKRVDFQAAMESMKLQAESARDALAAELEAKRIDIQAAMESMNLQAETVRTDLQQSIDASGKDADAQMLQIRAELDQVTEECTTKKAELLAGIDALSREEEFRQGEVQRLSTANSVALREFEAMTSNKEQMSVQLLSLLKEQETHDARLIELRRQISDAEAQSRKVQELVEAREDQVKVAERRLQGIEQERSALEASIRELTVSENRLKSLLPQLQESELREAALTAAIATLLTRQQESESHNESLAANTLRLQGELAAFETQSAETRSLLEANIAELQQNKQSHSDDYDSFVTETNTVRTSLTEQRTAAEEELAKRQTELARETASLQETIAQRQELERQCNELADTEKKLAEARAGVQKTEAQRRELDTWIKELQSKRDASQKALDGLHHEEEASRGRLEVLRGKEKDLRSELDQLAQKEQEDRVRFEELRRLTTEADREHEAHMEELSRTLELTRRELADMEVKLAPLREWKESMDKRYARLASLPEDSAEARELWKEIEAEKAGLGQLIGAGGKGTRGVSLNESILRGMSGAGEGAAAAETPAPGQRPGLKGRGKTKLHAPLGLTEGETPEERGNVGPAGTGAMLSGTGQEMALRARLSRLRESVQREATRLEFLRQERAREETRKTASSSNEPMLKEQERQVEVKLRREEEKLATIERKIEIAEMEEEKRRERLAELERKLTELKTDILEHERSRSEAVRKADIAAQAEARVTEDMAGRARSAVEHEPPRVDRPVSAPPPEARPKLKTMGVPLTAPEPVDIPDSEKGMGELLLGQKPE